MARSLERLGFWPVRRRGVPSDMGSSADSLPCAQARKQDIQTALE